MSSKISPSQDNDYVGDKTRRIVGHDALKRVSRIVQDWQTGYQDDARLAKRFTLGLALFALLSLALFVFFFIR